MGPDRDTFFRLMRDFYSVRGARLRGLEWDLEPLFRMAGAPLWPEGTDCGVAHDRRRRRLRERTHPMPGEDAGVCHPFPSCDGPVNLEAIEDIAERFHDQACSVLGYGRVVELGSLLGRALLDPLFLRLGARNPNAYLNLQFLALYRATAAAAGLETEEELLSVYIRRIIGDEDDCREVEPEQIEDESPLSMQAG